MGEKLSVQKLVSAALDLLKAGKKLKFNVELKNPEALLGDKQSQEGGNSWCCKKHLSCCHKEQESEIIPVVKPSDIKESQEGGNSWCCKKHLSCCHKEQESEIIPVVKPSDIKESQEGGNSW